MNPYTYRITSDEQTGRPIVWIDYDGNPSVFQPHHPNAVGGAPWDSVEEAEAWAQAAVAEFAAQEQVAFDAAAAEEEARAAERAAAEEDRARLVRIEEMLTALLAGK